MDSFLNFPPCKHRFACVQCRNDKKFIENMQKRFGEWECPEGIAFGTSLESMPNHIQSKIKAYQKRVDSRSQNRPTLIERQTGAKSSDKIVEKNLKPVHSFIDLPMCKQRAVCVECRNNKAFRERMEKQFGRWKCPEGILVGTPLDKMPIQIQKINESKKAKARENKKRVEGIKQDLLDIEELIPPQASEKFDRIKYYFFPELKVSSDCIHKGKSKKVEERCCGGKVKIVDGFECKLKGDVSNRACRNCSDFKKRRG